MSHGKLPTVRSAEFVETFFTSAALVREVGYVELTPEIYSLAKGHFAERKLGTAFGSGESQVGMTLEKLLARENEAVRFLIEKGLMLCALASIATTGGIIFVLAFETVAFLREVPITDFLFGTEWTPLFVTPRFGVLPLVVGTTLVSLIAMVVALPMGLLSAIYLSEYADERVRRVIKPILEILAGVPTVVYGYFALLFVTPLLQRLLPDLAGFNALGPGIVMGIMILPLVSSLAEDAMHGVPRGLREGSYALGATKMQTSLRVVVPAAFSGITAAFILAMSRAIGETRSWRSQPDSSRA